MYNLNYLYDVRVSSSSNIFSSGAMNSSIPGGNEMVISSKCYASYEECAQALTQLMAVLASTEAQIVGKNYAIVTKTNPLFSGQKADNETWDKMIVLKAFVADAEELKTSNKLTFDIVGQLRISQASLDAIKSANSVSYQ